MDLMKSMIIAASGMRAQSGRMRVISENLANSSSTAREPGGAPYRRQVVTFQAELDRKTDAKLVKTGPIAADTSPFGRKYQPGHPAADENGYVLTPNVNALVEMMDMREAQRGFEANLNVIESARRMMARTLDILRG